MRATMAWIAGMVVLLLCGGQVRAGIVTWYTNGQESTVTYAGGVQSSDEAHSGAYSETFAPGSTFHSSSIRALPALESGESITSFVYSVWLKDNGTTAQQYRRYLRFYTSAGGAGASAWSSSSYNGIGSGWGKLTYDILSIVNQRIGEGYSHMLFSVRAYEASGLYTNFYADDVLFEYGLLSTNPATITAHPQSQTKGVGETATFSVTAAGTQPLVYQWQKNAANLTGETNTSYTTPTLTLAFDGATYRCIVTNAYGTDTSSNATLSVNTTLVLYSNGMETAAIYGNGSQTNGEARSGTYSEIFSNGSFNSAVINVDLPDLDVNQTFTNFSHSVWFMDNNDPDQIYRIGIYLYNPGTSDELPVYSTAYGSIGAGWNERFQDLTSYVNLNYTNGYTRISKIYVRAYDSGGTYVDYYVDDVQISTEIYTPPPPPPKGTLIVVK